MMRFCKLKNKKLNRIEARLIKCADFLTDLQSFPKYQKYFVKKEEDNKNWYEQVGNVESFYMYQQLSIGQEQPVYGLCQYIHFRRRGYDDGVTIFGLYPVDDDGKINGLLKGVRLIEGDKDAAVREILDTGMKGWGRQFLAGQMIYMDLNDLKSYVNEQVEEKQSLK